VKGMSLLQQSIQEKLAKKKNKKPKIKILQKGGTILGDMTSKKGLKRLGKNLAGLGLIAGAIGLGAKAASAGERAVSDPIERAVAKKRMLKANPDIKKNYTPKEITTYFRTVHAFSPKVAKDPVAAGATMRRLLAYKDVGPQSQDLQGLSTIQKNLAQARKASGPLGDSLTTGTLSGISSLG